MTIAVPLDRDSPVPLTRQLYEFWRTGIVSGRFPRGERVPSTREAAAALGISRGTVAEAYEQLMSEGYFQSVRGSGTYVCEELPDPDEPPDDPQVRSGDSTAQPGSARERLSGDSMPWPSGDDSGSRSFGDSGPWSSGEAGPRSVDVGGLVRLSSLGEELRRDAAPAAKREGYISLVPAGPDLSLFPLDLWRRLSVSSLKSIGTGALDYAEHGQGYLPLREEIAKYLSRTRGISCSADQIVVVSGSQQGLDLCARLFLEPGDEVALENPAYVGARHVFEASGAQLRPVPVDAEGLVCGELGEAEKLVYVTPARQFPTGVALSAQRRKELMAWARQHRAVIIEDDYDSEYRYGGVRMPALYGAANSVAVIYCGSFSKVMFPGLRIGYLIVPPSLVTPFARAKWLADRHTPVHQQATLHRFMSEGHLERHIRRMRRTYAQRRAVLVEALQRHFGDRAHVLGEAAGTHAYVRLDDPGIAVRAERNKVELRKADRYFIGPPPPNEYLLEFSMLSERSIREGIRRLAP